MWLSVLEARAGWLTGICLPARRRTEGVVSDKKLREDVDERWGCHRRWLRIGKPTPGRHIRRAVCSVAPFHNHRAEGIWPKGGEGHRVNDSHSVPSRSATLRVLFVNKGINEEKGWETARVSLDSNQVSSSRCVSHRT